MKLKSLLKKSGYLSISFKRLKTNHIQVKAEINSVKGVFIIDTGASNSCIDLKLCDFYIACAFRPYLAVNQLLEYCSLEVMKSVLFAGVRCVYIDVFNSNLSDDNI